MLLLEPSHESEPCQLQGETKPRATDAQHQGGETKYLECRVSGCLALGEDTEVWSSTGL